MVKQLGNKNIPCAFSKIHYEQLHLPADKQPNVSQRNKTCLQQEGGAHREATTAAALHKEELRIELKHEECTLRWVSLQEWEPALQFGTAYETSPWDEKVSIPLTENSLEFQIKE